MSRPPSGGEAGSTSPSVAAKAIHGPPKMPVLQISILLICRFAEPVMFASTFPYLPAMMSHLGAPEHSIAKYVGWTAAVFSISQFVTAIPWGYLSDHIGRKPVILTCLFLALVNCLLFGMCTSLPMVLAVQAARGFFNGNVGILRTVIAELVPWVELQPRAFSLSPLVWTLGTVVGPMIGGALAQPAMKYPQLFRSDSIWAKYPFALPNVVIALFFVNSLIVGFLFLKETLPAKRNQFDVGIALGDKLISCGTIEKPEVHRGNDDDPDETDSLLPAQVSPYASADNADNDSSSAKGTAPLSTKDRWVQMLNRQTLFILAAYMCFAMQSAACDSILPVFLYSKPISLNYRQTIQSPLKFFGGFGLDPQAMGTIYTVTGIIDIAVQFLLYPSIARRYGVITCFRFSAILLPCIYFFMPLLALGVPSHPTLSYFALGTLMLTRLIVSVFFFPSCTILMTQSAPSLEVLGTLNGVATSISAIGRASGPALIGFLFSVGSSRGYLVLPWWVLTVITTGCCWVCLRVRDPLAR